MSQRVKAKWPSAILTALLLSCTLGLFGPAQIFLTNALEFQFDFLILLPLLAGVSLCLFLALAPALALLPERFRLHQRAVAVGLALGFLFWLQGNILLWQYGPLGGQAIDWGGKRLHGLIDTPLWVVVLALAGWRPGFLYRQAKRIALMLLAVQLLSTGTTLLRQPETPSFKRYQINHVMDFDFSSRRNVILLVLDSFQSDVFQEIIDQEPAFAEIFAGFTYFRNTTGGFPSTYGAIPLLLTGETYTNAEPIQHFLAQAYRSGSSIPFQLFRRDWRVDLVPAVQNTIFYDPGVFSNIKERRPTVRTARLVWLYDLTLFRYLPHFVKREVHHGGRWFLSRLIHKDLLATLLGGEEEEWGKLEERVRARRRQRRHFPHISPKTRRLGLDRLRRSLPVNSDSRFVVSFLMQAAAVTDGNVFKFFHWRGPHEPIQMDGEFRPVARPLNRANIVDLARAELRLVRMFLDGLREIGAYEQALIFVLGDHGHPWGGIGLRLPAGLGTASGQGEPGIDRVLRSGIPLLLVKRPGDAGALRVSDAPAAMVDVSATVFAELGLDARGEGQPLFAIDPDLPRQRRFLHYSWQHSAWMNPYLPPLVEYRIRGHAWLAPSWQATGNVFRPGR